MNLVISYNLQLKETYWMLFPLLNMVYISYITIFLRPINMNCDTRRAWEYLYTTFSTFPKPKDAFRHNLNQHNTPLNFLPFFPSF